MSATTEFLLSLEDAQLAADRAAYEVSTELCTLSNLVWRAGKVEGPDLDTPLCEVDADWLEGMRECLKEALTSLDELVAANDAF